MITVKLNFSSHARLISCHTEGHSGYAAHGHDIVCAATTILLRTAIEVFEANNILIDKQIPKRGFLSFAVQNTTNLTVADLKTDTKTECIGEFLQKGFLSLQQEFPDNIRVQIVKKDN